MLKGKIAVVTGASRGIGRAIAVKLAAEGAVVIINYNRSKDEAEKVKEQIEASGGQVKLIQCNVASFESCEKMFEEVMKEFGRIDILVNNAGIAHIGLLSDMSDEEWCNLLDTNLSSVFYCSREAIPKMVSKKSGKIINISSMWGTVGASCEAAYSATKSGIHGLTRALAKELAPSNIQVNAIACGAIETSMNAQLSAEEKSAFEEEIPAGRFGTPQEVADLVWNLVNSPSYLTGQIIGLDGGYI